MDSELLLSTEILFAEQQRIGKERRRFLLFTGFDFGLISILWIIFTVTKGSDWREDFLNQCNFTNPKFFSTSLFDVFLLSFARLIWLLIWYGVISWNHWIPVGISTGLTTAFLVTKIIFFFLEAANAHTADPLAYAIPICSFVIAWIELYLLDIKTLPKERQAREESAGISNEGHRVGPVRHFVGPGYVSDYRTAGEHSTDSDDDTASENSRQSRRRRKSTNEKDVVYRAYANFEYIRLGKQAFETGKSLLHQSESWSKKHSNPLIRATTLKEYGRVFYVKEEFPVSVETLFRILYTESESVPSWNKLVLETKTVLRINNNVDVTYSISAPALRNYVSSRDFLDVRYFEKHGRIYSIASISVRSDLRPPQAGSKIVRGENGPNYCLLKPSHISENSCIFEWIMNTDLKGNLPRKIVDNSLTSFLLDFIKSLEVHLKNFDQISN